MNGPEELLFKYKVEWLGFFRVADRFKLEQGHCITLYNIPRSSHRCPACCMGV